MKIPLNKAACMSHILMLVSVGYRWWIRGEMPFEKATGFAAKMAELYPIHATADQRSWFKKTRRYNAMLVMFPHDKDKSKVMFWLLATDGKAPKSYVEIHSREKLSRVDSTPVIWGDQYQCLKVQRSGKTETRFTWQMRPDYFNRLSASVKEASDSGAPALNDLFNNYLMHMPMFSGIRDQVFALDAVGRATWKKQKRNQPYPEIFKSLPIMPKISVFGDLTLSVLIERMRAEEMERNKSAAAQADALLKGHDHDDVL